MRTVFSYLFIILSGILIYGLTVRGDSNIISTSNVLHATTDTGSPFESSHERSPYATLLSLVNNKSYSLNQALADFSSPDVGKYKGKYYSFFPIGIVVAMLPLYFIGQYFHNPVLFSYFVSPFFGIMSMVLLFTICNEIFKFPTWISVFSALLFGFSSTFWSYAVTIYQHSLTSFLLLLSFYAIWRYKQKRKVYWLFGIIFSLCYGYAIWVDFPNAILFSPLLIYFITSSAYIRKRRQKLKITFPQSFVFSMIIISGIIGGLLFFDKVQFGNWLQTSNTLKRYTYKVVDNKKVITGNKKSSKDGNIFIEERVVNGLYILTVSSERGLFYYSPIFLLALLGIAKNMRKINFELAVLIGLIATNIFLYASFDDPWGGWSYGPRYLIPSLGPLAVFVGLYLKQREEKIFAKALVFFLTIVSAAIALLGAITSNLVPPRSDALALHIPSYNFFLNLRYLKEGIISSYAYKIYFIHVFPGVLFYFFIYTIVFAIFFFTMNILSCFELKWYEKKFNF